MMVAILLGWLLISLVTSSRILLWSNGLILGIFSMLLVSVGILLSILFGKLFVFIVLFSVDCLGRLVVMVLMVVSDLCLWVSMKSVSSIMRSILVFLLRLR